MFLFFVRRKEIHFLFAIEAFGCCIFSRMHYVETMKNIVLIDKNQEWVHKNTAYKHHLLTYFHSFLLALLPQQFFKCMSATLLLFFVRIFLKVFMVEMKRERAHFLFYLIFPSNLCSLFSLYFRMVVCCIFCSEVLCVFP